jgi:hypothetical protein
LQPVAAYAFDEGSGTLATDGTGNGHTGTLVSASFISSGKYLGAVSFPGTRSYVTVANAAGLDLRGAMTLEAWVKPAVTRSGYATIIGKTAGASAFRYRLELRGGVPAVSGDIGGVLATARARTSLPVGKWSYLAGSYNGSALDLYVNDKRVGSVPARGALSSSTGALEIGGDNVGKGDLDGAIDNVRIYGGARTAAQISSDGTTPVARVEHTAPKRLSLTIHPVNNGLPRISGIPTVGTSLSVSNGTWTNSPTSYTYQWQDCNASGASCTDISGATSSSYTMRSSDTLSSIKAVVTAAN